MRFYFSPRVTIVSALFIALFARLSYWQWERHLFKQTYIKSLQARLLEPVAELSTILAEPRVDWTALPFRRVHIRGTYDFDHEMVLRNRKYEESPGVHVITPLKIDNSDKYILVSRGFVPFSKASRENRAAYQKEKNADFIGLMKEDVPRRFLAPSDPDSGQGHEWVDAWLRVDIAGISKQLPYPLVPVWTELMGNGADKNIGTTIINEKSDRDDIFLPAKGDVVQTPETAPKGDYPIPTYDTVVPPGRHLGYVWEWGAMAFMTLLIALVLQLRPSKKNLSETQNSVPAPSM